MKNYFSVENKNVLITGSTRGIGRNFALGFAEAGARVFINGRTEETVCKTVLDMRNAGLKAESSVFDVTDGKSIEDAVKKIEKSAGSIDVLINNAGIHKRGMLKDLSFEDWQAVIDTNLSSAFLVSKYAVRNMIRNKKGKIINITSLMAEAARPSTGNYCAAKGGLKMLTKAMASEWGNYNIQVNAIGPGYILTEMTENLAADGEFDAWVKAETPLKRWGKPEDLLGTAIFLASAASDYITGHTIYVDGGWFSSL